MPIVAIDLSEDETARVDEVADREKRARKAQVHILALIGLEVVEAEQSTKQPTAAEPAPPVPQKLADEISAKFMRSIPVASSPRFFRETSTGMEWEFRNGVMTTDGEDSIFTSPEELLSELTVEEIDEFGEPINWEVDP